MFVAPTSRPEMNVAFGESKTVLVVGQAAKRDRLPYETLNYRRLHGGYTILLARTGLLENELSDMEGIDVVKVLRENPMIAGTLIIALSAFPHMKARCLDSGGNGFIQKPIKALDLLTQLRKLTKV